MGVDELADAIRAAERYLSLAAEVEAARGLKERWIKRAEAQVSFPWKQGVGRRMGGWLGGLPASKHPSQPPACLLSHHLSHTCPKHPAGPV